MVIFDISLVFADQGGIASKLDVHGDKKISDVNGNR